MYTKKEIVPMKNIICVFILICVAGLYAIHSKPTKSPSNTYQNQSLDSILLSEITPDSTEAEKLFHAIGLDGKLNFEAFDLAMLGYENMNMSFKNKDIITVIDFSLPSTDKRMYVIDLKNKKLLYHTIVSHGRNSGQKYATSFSNKHGSFQSSLGFYSTANTYQGGNGYSLVLNGLEKGINDQAKPRAVVIHGADYCSESVIKSTGRLGRSYGCPALPRHLNRSIINTIKDGSMLFIYAKNEQYLANSKALKTSPTMLAQHDELSTEKTQGAIN